MSDSRVPGESQQPGYTSARRKSEVSEKLHQAVAFHKQGRLAQAEHLYREIIKQAPDHFDALHMLGAIEYQRGRLEAAVNLIERAIKIDPDYSLAHYNLGNALRDFKRPQAALASYERALVLDPNYAEALCGRGVVLQDLDRAEEALASIDRALALKPVYFDALHNRGGVLIQLGRYEDALASFRKALEVNPDSDPSWRGLSECLRFCATVPGEEYRPLITAVLTRNNLNPQDTERIAVGMISRDPLVQEFLRLSSSPGICEQRVMSAIDDGSFRSFFEMPLMIAVLEETIITNYRLELFLTILRRVLLTLAMRLHAIIEWKPVQRFASALALQCFANEYIYAESGAERELVTSLIDKISRAIQKREKLPAIWISLLGAYHPLHKFEFPDQLEDLLEPGHTVQELIKRQLLEPKLEEQIKKQIVRATKIENRVSSAVREQYEENPYPRWRRGRRGEAESFENFIREMFPKQPVVGSLPECPEILVAGCGTGFHPTQTARRFKNARVLAFDLSLSSLAYAKRVTAELGIDNIDYFQADILELENFDKRFDIIECLGVLHHLHDPLEGWRILEALLRPGGYMHVGLYSERARHHITALQQFIKERGFASRPEDIRQCRQLIMTKEIESLQERNIGDDFFSMSCCRDLLFHVQEHLFSPAKIASCIEKLDLEFLGFELPNYATKTHYRTLFPQDAACNSLANWGLFEQKYPSTFYNTYNFWVRKN